MNEESEEVFLSSPEIDIRNTFTSITRLLSKWHKIITRSFGLPNHTNNSLQASDGSEFIITIESIEKY